MIGLLLLVDAIALGVVAYRLDGLVRLLGDPLVHTSLSTLQAISEIDAAAVGAEVDLRRAAADEPRRK